MTYDKVRRTDHEDPVKTWPPFSVFKSKFFFCFETSKISRSFAI